MVEFTPSSSGRVYVSPAEIRKLKENMKKVPLIKEKSDMFHDKELLQAEIAFAEAQQNITSTQHHVVDEMDKSIKEHHPHMNIRKTRWKKLLGKLIVPNS